MDLKTADLGGPCTYADHGGTGPVLVLVHGLAGSHVNWMAVAPRLAETFRVLAPDLAGFGKNPLAGRTAALETNLALLTRFVEEVAGPPALLVGHSMGGLLTLQLAAGRPDLVSAAVLMSAASPGAAGGAMLPEQQALLESLLTGDLEAVAPFAHATAHAQGAEQLVDSAFASMHRRPVAPEVRQAHVELEAERALDPTTTLAYLQALRSLYDRREDFDGFDAAVRAVRAPVLVLHGEEDPLVPVANMRRAAALRPDWQTAWLPGVGHNVQMEAPEEFLAAVVPFFSRLAPGQPRQTEEAASP